MADRLYQSPRSFQLWAYSVSHSQLMFRSNQGGEWTTRLDVLFKGVHWMELMTTYDEFAIDHVASSPSQTAPGLFTYRIGNAKHRGQILALSVFIEETNRDYTQPSDPWDGRAAGGSMILGHR